MALVWWLPTTVLILGSLVLLTRIRAVERQIAETNVAVARLTTLGQGGATLETAITRTGSRRSRTTRNLTRTAGHSAPGADRGPTGTDR